ncbi:MAG: Tad domain-containing protein [Clostridia bacterium]|nr:Tad domain-containing protein [Clostridia bacterium]
MAKYFYNISKSRKGTSVVFFAVILTLISGFAALTIDIGSLVWQKNRLASAIDSAALAGAQELITNSGYANSVINTYIQKNIGTLKETNITVDNSNRTIQIKGAKSIETYFARVLGIKTMEIKSSAKAKVENISSLKGARPLAVIQQTFIYGNIYTLKEGAGDGTSGNYAAIALGGTGGSIYRDNLLNGFNSTISVGNQIQTETGNISGTTETCINQLVNGCIHTPRCTYQYYNKNCSRIIFLPIVNTLDVSGRKYVKVLGFGTFFLEGVTNQGGQADVTGRFITYSMQGETSSAVNDYGTYGIRLVE